jgi:hypothetical protein
MWITLDFRPSSETNECKGENDRRKESEHIWQSEHIEQLLACRRVGVDGLFRPAINIQAINRRATLRT